MTGFYAYIHRRADDGKVFYVGKGKGNRAHSNKGRNSHWVRTAKKHGMSSEIVVNCETEAEAFAYERYFIFMFRQLGHPWPWSAARRAAQEKGKSA